MVGATIKSYLDLDPYDSLELSCLMYILGRKPFTVPISKKVTEKFVFSIVVLNTYILKEPCRILFVFLPQLEIPFSQTTLTGRDCRWKKREEKKKIG